MLKWGDRSYLQVLRCHKQHWIHNLAFDHWSSIRMDLFPGGSLPFSLSLKAYHITGPDNVYLQGCSQLKWLSDMPNVLPGWNQEENSGILKSSSILKVTLSWWLILRKWGKVIFSFIFSGVLSKSVWTRGNLYSLYL